MIFAEDLKAAREELFVQEIIPEASVSHKHELRRLRVQLPEGKCAIVHQPEHVYEIKALIE